jgi:hypothetical protein
MKLCNCVSSEIEYFTMFTRQPRMICMEHRSNTEFIRVSSNLAYTLNFIKLHVFTRICTAKVCKKCVRYTAKVRTKNSK